LVQLVRLQINKNKNKNKNNSWVMMY
jgi:hypothetical protein